MSKKILIAVDDSIHSKNAVAYALNIHKALKDVKFTLMHVQSTISQYLLDEARFKPQAFADLEKVKKKNEENAMALLNRYKSQMVDVNIPANDIQLKSEPWKQGIAKDILETGQAGRFDALLLGRRGLSNLQEKFIGSVSANTVNNLKNTPVWLVDGKGPSQDIMIAVDGSESSYRAVDHLAYIIGGNPEVKISFFHVAPRLKDFCPVDFEEEHSESLEEIILQGDEHCIDQFYSQAQKRLNEAGIQENQLNYKASKSVLRVGKMVLNAYHEGKFGTLVVGRHGLNRMYFIGSASRYLLNKFSGGALWVIP